MELQVMCKTEDAPRVAEICKAAFREGPKMFGVTIMDGESKIGKNWFDTH